MIRIGQALEELAYENEADARFISKYIKKLEKENKDLKKEIKDLKNMLKKKKGVKNNE